MGALRSLKILVLTIPIIVGGWLLMRGTQNGVAIYPDSVVYLTGARSLLQGHGFTIEDSDGTYNVITNFPPLYSMCIALASIKDHDVITDARGLQIVLFAAAVAIAMLFTFLCTRSFVPTFLAGIFWMLSTDFVSYQTVILSEGLFILFSICSLALLYHVLRNEKSLPWLVLSALATSAAWLSRFAGLAWVVGGFLAIAFFSSESIARRARNAVLFGVVASIGNVFWTVHIAQKDQPVLGRVFHLTHFLGREHVASILNTLRLWAWRQTDSHQLLYLGFYAGLVVFLLASVKKFNGNRRADSGGVWGVKMLLLYMFCYSAVLVSAAAFFQGDLFIDSLRILMPLHLLLLLFVVIQGYRISKFFSSNWTHILVGFCCLFWIFLGVRATKYTLLAVSNPDSLMFNSPLYRDSSLIAAIKKMPHETMIYSNLGYPVMLYADKECEGMPAAFDISTQRPNPDFDNQIRDMRTDILENKALVAYFKKGDGWIIAPALEEIRKRIPLVLIATYTDGSLWKADPSSSSMVH